MFIFAFRNIIHTYLIKTLRLSLRLKQQIITFILLLIMSKYVFPQYSEIFCLSTYYRSEYLLDFSVQQYSAPPHLLLQILKKRMLDSCQCTPDIKKNCYNPLQLLVDSLVMKSSRHHETRLLYVVILLKCQSGVKMHLVSFHKSYEFEYFYY